MKLFCNALYVALYLICALAFGCIWLISAAVDWAERRLDRLAFGDGPRTFKECLEAILFWVVLGLVIHFYF